MKLIFDNLSVEDAKELLSCVNINVENLKFTPDEPAPQADNNRSDEIALLNKLKHDMEICDDVLADVDSWTERINAVIAQLRAVR